VTGAFPLQLFVDILPAVIYNFFFPQYFEYVIIHYLILATLFGMYLTLVIDMFKGGRFVSFSSLSVGVASLFGISLGVTCLSCGIVGGYLVLSVVTALSTAGFVGEESIFFLVLGELLLILSIFLLLYGVAKVSRSK
jgi:hypothetical protein